MIKIWQVKWIKCQEKTRPKMSLSQVMKRVCKTGNLHMSSWKISLIKISLSSKENTRSIEWNFLNRLSLIIWMMMKVRMRQNRLLNMLCKRNEYRSLKSKWERNDKHFFQWLKMMKEVEIKMIRKSTFHYQDQKAEIQIIIHIPKLTLSQLKK